MLKNKTHKIISISPTSHRSSAQHSGNKTTTPIKPFQVPTRTNTVKTTARPEGSIMIEETYKKSENKQKIIESVFVTSYKDDIYQKADQSNKQHKTRKQINMDEILNRIGKTYDNDLNNTSKQLLKKTEISHLRQVLRQAKMLVKTREENNIDPLKNLHNSKPCIQSLSFSIRQQIFTYFSNLHKQLYNKQKQLYQELQEKAYMLNEKNMTKCFQQSVLKKSIQKCEIDVNSNYNQIIKQLQISQLTDICNSYIEKMQFYMDMIKTQYTIKVNLPSSSDLLNFLPNIQVVIEKEPQKCETLLQNNFLLQNSNKEVKKNDSQKVIIRQSLGRHTKNVRSNLEDIENLPFSKIKMRDISYNNQNHPRIASARGKY